MGKGLRNHYIYIYIYIYIMMGKLQHAHASDFLDMDM